MNESCLRRWLLCSVLVLPAVASAQSTATVPSPAPPQTASPWTPVLTGSYFTRYEFRANYDDMGVSRGRFLEGDAVFYRLRLGISTGPIELGKVDVALQFTPQAAGTFGSLGPNTIADAALGLHEAYARVAGDYVRLDAGRFELNYGDSFILGNLDWNEVARSFDGVRTRLSMSPTSAWLDVFGTLIDEGRDPALGAPTRGFGDGDIWFYGAYAALGPAITKGLDLDAYALVNAWHGQKGLRVDPTLPDVYRRKSARQITLGMRAKQRIGWVDYRFEGGFQAGSRLGAAPTAMTLVATQPSVDVLAYQGDLEAGLNLLADKLRVGLEGMFASGDDPSTGKNEGWDELYPTAHKFLGLADVFNQNNVKRTNVASGVLHVTVKPVKDIVVQLDGHLFARPEKMSAAGKEGYAGSEIDLGLSYTIVKGLKARALYCIFFADPDFYPVSTALMPRGGEADPIHFGEFELRYDL